MRKIAIILLAAVSFSVGAFDVYGFRFEKTEITWSLKSRVTRRVRKEIDAAFRDWTEASGLTFVEADSGADVEVDFGMTGGVANGILASTTISVSGDNRITSSSIWINGRDYKWFGRRGYSLRSVLSHEIGHAIGLDHSDVRSSLMYQYFYWGEVRTLGPDDLAGVAFLYGDLLAPKTVSDQF
jgi:predicted Zn-dependent protease